MRVPSLLCQPIPVVSATENTPAVADAARGEFADPRIGFGFPDADPAGDFDAQTRFTPWTSVA